MTKPEQINLIESIEDLQLINGTASDRTLLKKLGKLDQHAEQFIARSPFLVLATSSNEGVDSTPRGDAPGFVKVIDETTLLIAERPGNRIADSLRNIMANPELGLLLMIPGMNETLRVNGRGYVTDHPLYLEQLIERGKLPKLAIIVDVTEVFFHCPKAYVRSKLWDPAEHMNRGDLPTLGKMLLEQVTGAASTPEAARELDQHLLDDVENNLY